MTQNSDPVEETTMDDPGHDWHDYDMDVCDWEVRRRWRSDIGVFEYDIRSFQLDRQINGLDAATWDKVRSGEIDEKSLPYGTYERGGSDGNA